MIFSDPRNAKIILTVFGSIIVVGVIFCTCFALLPALMPSGDDETDEAMAEDVVLDGEIGPEPGQQLSPVEQALVGIWRKAYSSGDKAYVRFNADGTACKWEEKNGSRSGYSNFVHWEIDEANPVDEGCFSVMMKWPNDNEYEFTFDYLEDKIWPEDYSANLRYSRSSSNKQCD
jgi:hypothetical protein